jgi:hypothetical protein
MLIWAKQNILQLWKFGGSSFYSNRQILIAGKVESEKMFYLKMISTAKHI